MSDTFDLSCVSKKDMNLLADSIENFLDFSEDIIIYRRDLDEKLVERLKRGRAYTRDTIIKKLRKGDKSLFKDEDEWVHLN